MTARRPVIRIRSIAAVLAVATAPALSTGRALAQAPAAKPGAEVPVSSEPGSTAASFGDWVLRCQRVGEAEKAERLCEVAQSMQVKGQSAPIAQIAVGRLGREPLRITAVLPVAVSFSGSVQVHSSPAGEDPAAAKASPPVDLAWRRCLPGGCFADASATDDALKRWRSSPGPGRILFKDPAGQEVTIPLSLRGFPQAFDALAKEIRQ